ncbi:MAG: Tim44-like domain-containing protein, partial [Gammaproteobacteria bacterium]|nr:Tim44-like domain-containing protein [Gammaproteobacteria bacterium]
GGGGSFGSKMFQQKPAKRASSATASKAQQQNLNRKQEMSKKGGMMGLLGGLMIGGILGALFFGGAFENINFMDILFFGLIAFLIYKFVMSRKPPQPAAANGMNFNDIDSESVNQYRQADAQFGSAAVEAEQENILKTGKIPKGFDSQSFLNGAENVYRLLQEAWDKKQLGDLREFCTDNVFAELQDQIKARTGENHTEILSLSSELVNLEITGNSTEATVIFTAELKEHDAQHTAPETVRVQEAWYFLRPNNRQEHTWLLDAIQQIEA